MKECSPPFLFCSKKIVAVFPHTVGRTPAPHIMEERKVRMSWY